MNNSAIYLGAMSIATTNTPKMVKFYERVFNTRLEPFQMGEYELYKGRVGNLDITLTPNELFGIRAERSRYQLSFVVPDLQEYLQRVQRAGGMQTQEVNIDTNNLEKYCGIIDPDGNPIELVELLPTQASPAY